MAARRSPFDLRLRNLRLRSKLGLGLGVAAILPILAASATAVLVVLSRIDEASRGETLRAARIALHLVLRQARKQQDDADRLAKDGVLADLLVTSPGAVQSYLSSQEASPGEGLLEIADGHGRLVAQRSMLGPEMARALTVGEGGEEVRRALEYERRVTLIAAGGQLALRACAPVIDEAYRLRGAGCTTLPLDATFADQLKAALAADVVFYAAAAPNASTFFGPDGRRLRGPAVPPALASAVLRGQAATDRADVLGQSYNFAFEPLQELDGQRVGMVAIATSRQALLGAKRQAVRVLGLGAAGAVFFALLFALGFSRGLARPLGRLHRAALAVAQGNLEQHIPVETGDEIGELAQAFGVMTRVLKDNQDRLAAFSEQLEQKVTERTRELTLANRALEQALRELRETQAQLVHSERMAGLGVLVAGVVHEINSPAAAIKGTVDALADNLARMMARARGLGMAQLPEEARTRFYKLLETLGPRLAQATLEPPVKVRREARELAGRLTALGVPETYAPAMVLVELGVAEAAYELARLGGSAGLGALVGYLEEFAYLQRNLAAIKAAIYSIARIVGALKSYSHLDQEQISEADIHEGIENTLVILHHELKYGISVTRRFGLLPKVRVFVDELNQVWTNLIHNAVQALGGRGEIMVETAHEGSEVVVRITDSGPGITPEVLPRIFEPFFTTKVKGEGSGLGLVIVKRIIDKHGGQIQVASEPGRTAFTVRLPVEGPTR